MEVALVRTHPSRVLVGGLLAITTLLVSAPARAWQQPEADRTIEEVRVTGNRLVATHEIMAQIRTRPGVPVDRGLLEQDVKRIIATKQFTDVRVEYLDEAHGLVVLFRVLEANRIQQVTIHGNRAMTDKFLLEKAGLQTTRLFDMARTGDAARRIEDEYHLKGYPFAQVEVVQGDKTGDRQLIFRVDEGPKVAITDIDFRFLDGDTIGKRRLATQIRTKRRKLGLFGGKYNARDIDDDVYRLESYYQGLGYFDVKVGREKRFTEDRSKLTIVFVVSEGRRYSIRNVIFEGQDRLAKHELADGLTVSAGEPFNQQKVVADTRKIQDKYGAMGYVDASVKPDVRFLDDQQTGLVDLKYEIQEGMQYRVGRIFVTGNHITKDTVIRRELRIYPGELLDSVKLRRSERNLRNTQLFTGSGPGSGGIQIIPVSAQVRDPGIGEGLSSQGPNIRDGYKDVEIRVNEGQTGRLLFGLGVNSDAGLLGNIVISEQNFDLFRWPCDLADLFYGDAFRGGGQEFRLEAAPGTEFSRYLLSWREPRLGDLPYSLGVSGYYFTRFYNEYDEQRGGGRVTVGHNFSDFTRATVGLRMENVEVSDVDFPTPPDLLAVAGDNFLTALSLTLEHDTRDNAFMPGSGHLASVNFEQGFGDFTFPKVTLDGRQFWTISQRPDQSGRHIMSIRGTVGFAGDDTPLFERFYAGGFRNFRGFRFRGVGPEQFGSKIGGEFMALGSLEYLMPITADDTLSMVFFSDYGTVESNVTIRDFRATAGFGFRVTVPMLGPVPLAFDFSFPLAKADFDDTQVFSFFVGLFR